MTKCNEESAGAPALRTGDATAACSLAPDQRSERLDWIRREILPHAVETERLDRGLALELAAAPGLAAVLDRLVALERACCPGLAFERTASATPGRLRLVIRGLDPDAAFRPAAEPPCSYGSSTSRTFARSE